LHLLTCVCIIWATFPPHLHLQAEPIPSTCSPILLNKNIKDNKKNMAVLLVWDEDSYTGRFLLLFPCTWKPKLVLFYQTSSLLPGSFPIVASASLRLLYSLLYSEHINHIQVLGFLPFSYISCMHFPLSVWPISNNITAFVLDL
jgi:hypothetical protein